MRFQKSGPTALFDYEKNMGKVGKAVSKGFPLLFKGKAKLRFIDDTQYIE